MLVLVLLCLERLSSMLSPSVTSLSKSFVELGSVRISKMKATHASVTTPLDCHNVEDHIHSMPLMFLFPRFYHFLCLKLPPSSLPLLSFSTPAPPLLLLVLLQLLPLSLLMLVLQLCKTMMFLLLLLSAVEPSLERLCVSHDCCYCCYFRLLKSLSIRLTSRLWSWVEL